MDIEKIARQAGFSLNEEDKAACMKKLNKILEEAKALPDLDGDSND